jgi:hypothetical protein
MRSADLLVMARELRALFFWAAATATMAGSAVAAPAAGEATSCSRARVAALYSTGILREGLPQMARQCGEVWSEARGVERAWIATSSCFRLSRVTACCPLAYPVVAAVGLAWLPVGLAVGPLLSEPARAQVCEMPELPPQEPADRPPDASGIGDGMPDQGRRDR